MKLYLKPQTLKLRQNGYSIADIARKFAVSESTVSKWCRGIVLNREQVEVLEKRTKHKINRFMLLVAKQKRNRDKQKNKIFKKSLQKTSQLTKRDLFIAGIALYWAEGFKHEAESRIGFCSSDPTMIKFMLAFLQSHFEIPMTAISPRLTINYYFKNKVDEIESYWSDYLQIPREQFTRPFFQKVKQIKVYSDSNTYHGVLRIHVRKSSLLLHEMRGYLQGLRQFKAKSI